jgi:hypothetical protein
MEATTPLAVLQAYMDGSRDLDRAKLAQCFHPKAVLTGFLKDTPILGTPQLFLDDVDRIVAAGVRNTGYEAKIESLTEQGSVASANIVMSGFAGLNFKDYMHLVEESGRWSIISKLFTTI